MREIVCTASKEGAAHEYLHQEHISSAHHPHPVSPEILRCLPYKSRVLILSLYYPRINRSISLCESTLKHPNPSLNITNTMEAFSTAMANRSLRAIRTVRALELLIVFDR